MTALALTLSGAFCFQPPPPLVTVAESKVRSPNRAFPSNLKWQATPTQNGRCCWLSPKATRSQLLISLHATNLGDGDEDKVSSYRAPSETHFGNFGFYCIIAALYWYFMVFGAAAASYGLPVPDFIPLIPGWPANDADFQDVIEDSYHFFYLSELLQNQDAPYVSPPRLAVFNLVEAWVFAFLPVLWKDPKRLPRPALLSSWALLGINLTNAFLAPYLAITELLGGKGKCNDSSVPETYPKNRLFSISFALIASLVVGYAAIQSTSVATSSDWKEFFDLAVTNRTYLAFCVDPIVLSIFQPLVLARVRNDGNTKSLDYVAFVGIIAWLLASDDEDFV